MRLIREPGRFVVPTEGWRSPTPEDYYREFEQCLIPHWPCPVCGKTAKYSLHYAFERDMIAFKCLTCGLLEVKYRDDGQRLPKDHQVPEERIGT